MELINKIKMRNAAANADGMKIESFSAGNFSKSFLMAFALSGSFCFLCL
jgi:hypothetical protein